MRAERAAIGPAAWLARWRQRVFLHAPGDGAAVTLRHSRIYILPTRRGLALIATIATMLVTSLNYGLALGFVVTFLMTGLIGAALLHAFRNVAGLTVRPGVAGDTFAGGRVPFSLVVSGHARARVALGIGTRDGTSRVLDIDADTLTTVTFDLDAPHRGAVPLGRVTLSSDYPLGLWRAWAYAHFPSTGVAFPVPEPGAPPLPPGAAGPDAKLHGRDDEADLSGLREYQRGDPLQRVAWKAVARGAGWYTKSFEGAGGGGPIVLDIAALPADLPLECKLSRLAAWVLAAERNGRPFALALTGQHLSAAQGREHRRAALTALALYRAPA
jgi:uncharacterized protein (DUF58 family)